MRSTGSAPGELSLQSRVAVISVRYIQVPVACFRAVVSVVSTYCVAHVDGSSLPRLCIRASVDALCRDGADEISRDPRIKRLKPRRESLAKPSKLPSNCCLAHLQLYKRPTGSYLPSVLHARKRPNAISRISCHHHHNILLLVQTRYLLTGTNQSANFSTKRLHGGWRCARTSSVRFLYAVRHNGISHALRGETINDAIFLETPACALQEGAAGRFCIL